MAITQSRQDKRFWTFVYSFREAFNVLQANDPLRMAGATAFFTTFALPAILIIIIQALRLLFEPRIISRQLFGELKEVIGPEATNEVVETLQAFRGIAQNWLIAGIGFVFLLFVATTLLKVMTSSVNQLWSIRPVARGNFRIIMVSRLKGVVLILATGVLFVLGIVGDSASAFIGEYLLRYWPNVGVYYNSALQYLLSVITATLWFSLVLYLLPDGRLNWKVLLTGAFVTGVLFNIGKIVLRWLLTYSNINSIYGASASMVLLLLFVFYVSLIFYYGATFANVWANASGKPVQPRKYAIRYQLQDVKPE